MLPIAANLLLERSVDEGIGLKSEEAKEDVLRMRVVRTGSKHCVE